MNSPAESVTINLLLQTWRSSAPVTIETVRVTGAPNDRYQDLLNVIATNREGGYPFIDYFDSDSGQRFSLHVDRTATMAQVVDALGEDAFADPPTLHLGMGGRGGDGGFTLVEMLEAAGQIKQVGEYVVGGLAVWKVVVATYYRKSRRFAKDWVDRGVISTELRQTVMATDHWPRSDFDKVFKLGNRGPELLRELGYERRDLGGEYWVEIASERFRAN